MERRRLLQLAGLGLSTSALAGGETVRQILDLTIDSEHRDLDDWHTTYADHRFALRTRSPGQVRDDLLIDLLALYRQLQVQEDVELQRVAAALATILANALTRLGDHGTAIHWWRTARTAADASGDIDLRLVVRAEEAGCGLYGQRDLNTVLRLTDRAQHIGDEHVPRCGLVMTVCHRAKVLALLGRHADAQHALTRLATMAENYTPADTYGYQDVLVGSIRFAESWVAALAGEQARADVARERVLTQPGLDYQYAINVRLHEAHCTVANGGIDAGTQQAAEILAGLPPNHRSNVISETANAILRAVPLDQQDRPAVREFREVLAHAAPTPALTSGT